MAAIPFVIERTYRAPAQKVWEAITDADKMRKWYFDLTGFEAKVGFEFSFAGKGSKGENYVHRCKVIEVVPGKKLSYTWQYDGFPGSSTVTFELFEENGKTRVRLTHEGLETFPQDKKDFSKGSFEAGWTEIIGKNLKEFVEV